MKIKLQKRFILFIAILLLFNPIIFQSSGTSIIKKSELSKTGGNTLYVGGPGFYDNIQDAIDDAKPGDTIFVYADDSPYCENLIVNKTINLIGENRGTTIIDGHTKNGIVVEIKSNFVSIEGFTIKGSYRFCGGIKINNSKFANISNNIILGNFWGIDLENSHFNKIIDNIILENQILGIMSDDFSTFNTIKFNHITKNYEAGIGFGFADSNKIINNNISYNEVGILLFYCSKNIISENIIFENKEYGIKFWHGKQNQIIKNDFINNNNNACFEIEHVWQNNRYLGNYWSDLTKKIKIITGEFYGTSHKWINVDWLPRKDPFN